MIPLPEATRGAVVAIALALAASPAIAGGMPSDEGPEVVSAAPAPESAAAEAEPAVAATHTAVLDATAPEDPEPAAVQRASDPPPLRPLVGKRDHR